MPMFKYQCEECDHVFDKIVKTSEKEDSVDCPECEDGEAERAQIFYGDHTIKYNADGFYQTDYNGKNTQ